MPKLNGVVRYEHWGWTAGTGIFIQLTSTVSARMGMEEIRPAVENGVSQANVATEALSRISSSAEETLERFHNMAYSMSEQSQAGPSIAGSVEQAAGEVTAWP